MSRRWKKKAPAARSSAPISPSATSRPAGWSERRTVAGVCLFLAAITLAVFGRTIHYGFVNYDDEIYVYDNPVVSRGLTWAGFRWALTYGDIGHWHPLTWLSHMLDCQLYGLNPAGHHLSNVLLHTVAVVLLFVVLRRMTGNMWRSAFVAAVFAIHPLRVESVAWVAERKDVLSAVFFMLTLMAYVEYVRRPWSLVRYGLVVMVFALGLLSKNMLVTLPLVLLLLDYWPLKRVSGFSPRAWLGLVAEKIPLLVLTVGSCVATALVPEKLTADLRLPLGLRLENAVVSYVTYLWQMIHPVGLACLYPNPTKGLPVWEVAGAAGLLVALSGVAWACRRSEPWLLVGWLWYVGMLVPVIGIVQISHYAHADRYTYLPQIGLYVLLTWTVAEMSGGWRHRRVALGVAAGMIVAALMAGASIQTAYWRNSETLWTHTLGCTSGNAIAHVNFGNALIRRVRVGDAIAQYQQALEIKSDYTEAHINLGNALLQEGKVDEATAQYQMALQINPGNAEVRYNLGSVLLQKGRVDEAIAQYRMALQNKPDYAEAQNNLGAALLQKGQVGEAIAQYRMALEIKPDYADAQNNLAWVLATCPQASLRNGNQAVVLAQRASQLTGGEDPVVLGTLAAAYAEAGRFPEAVATTQRALQLAGTQSNAALTDALQSQLKLYQAGLPFHLP